MARHIDTSLAELRCKYGNEDEAAYCYVIRTVVRREGVFYQEGSGPNWQGGLITLCTCKHHMRTFRTADEWKGVWVAGFSGVEAGGKRNALVYLMKVGHAYDSHHDLWHELDVEAARRAKTANMLGNIRGDVFEPRGELMGKDKFDPEEYKPPCSNHVHLKWQSWHKDIGYKSKYGRTAALLAGDPDHSFLWTKSRIVFDTSIGIGQKRLRMADLLEDRLEDIGV